MSDPDAARAEAARREWVRVGAVVEMTSVGVAIAHERKLLATTGEIRDIFHPVRRDEQIYVRRDTGGCEWWPTKAWRPR